MIKPVNRMTVMLIPSIDQQSFVIHRKYISKRV